MATEEPAVPETEEFPPTEVAPRKVRRPFYKDPLSIIGWGLALASIILYWYFFVRKHIPEFRFASDFITEQTTIRDILLHRASLPGILGDFMDPEYSAGDLLRDLETSEPVCGFRERCIYSQVGMALIGELIRRVSGLRWRDFVTQRILEPLGMSSSYADAFCLEQALGGECLC